ncbi:iron ABC transporter permease [Streptomyces sp. A73]|uniref:FecCD family ABC transporter permease n=1 Tax=Streptomyces sp. B15 TaxID=1537797 RepID=UPI001B3928C2|nr:iron ABC transporter permease [Streptomyces sp. B15]MBQ1121720.1 iron ABC transporter permease [Streptomyces sp. B15]MBQ1158129.1 iron ABC transporter permease [Streptomyces sp. A73]
MPIGSRTRCTLVATALVTVLVAGALAGLALGSARIPLGEVLAALTGRSQPGPFATIVLDVRLPRVLLAAVVGAGLALVGTVLQALVRNPLADPYLLGISSGASTGAVVVVVLGVGALSMQMGAFAGAMLALVVVYTMARRGGTSATLTTGRLVLAGVAVQYVLSALTSLLLVTSAEKEHLRAILFWTLGGLGQARWHTLPLPALVLAAGLLLLLALARPLDLLLAGEEGAMVLGLDTGRFRAAVFVLASLVTAVLVTVSGAIGFVGLMVPHAARMAVGAGHRALLPVAALGGAAFLVLADLAARTVAAPEEIPVGVLTALTGGPFFLWMLRRSQRTEGVAG